MQLAGTSWLLPEFSELSEIDFLISPMSKLLKAEYQIEKEPIRSSGDKLPNEIEPGQLARTLTDELFATPVSSSSASASLSLGIISRVIGATAQRASVDWAAPFSAKLEKRLSEASKPSKGRKCAWRDDEWFNQFGERSKAALASLEGGLAC